ncbi:hypothetical protein SCP_0212350 [Sparassis crispa]|uniref:Uncharacterized protein n=1 Tax=Sparassis crispa TaxID=139825 RepID=A0A401GD41_9APHY|nr:hypothetical protein SCP_0212350 [Sparassis crispa]GBE80033.1 hypothetical protein SCP_0212350 [Sparassis crispa]
MHGIKDLAVCAAGRSPEDVVATRVAAPKAVINGTALLPEDTCAQWAVVVSWLTVATAAAVPRTT